MTESSESSFDAMMRRWLLRMAGRYSPVLAIGLAVLMLVLFIPTKQPGSGVATTGGNGSTNPALSSGASGGPSTAGTGSGAAATGASTGGSGAIAGSPNTVAGAAVSGSGSSSSGTSGAASAGPTGTGTSSGSGRAYGVSVAGVTCSPGAPQFTWATQAPGCVPAWTGDNGGATAPGVTGSTITLTYRLPNSSEQTAVDAIVGSADINETDYVDDLDSYIAFFNKQFELYGRKVVLKTFDGQGDYLEEDQGQDLAATQSDAETAKDLGAFGDVTFPLVSSEYYAEDLAAEHVVAFSGVGLPQSWYEQYAPYEYSTLGQTGTNSLANATQIVCRRMAGLPAVYSGNFTSTTRKFGVIYPNEPTYQDEVAAFVKELQSTCGVDIASSDQISYTINTSDYASESAEAIAKLKSDHVTTVICDCGPLVPVFLTDSAGTDDYYPEWLTPAFGDTIARDYNQKVWSHAMVIGSEFPPIDTIEAYKAFQVGYPGKQPAEMEPNSPPYFYAAFYTLLQVFDALQAAGPDLTPATFERGMFSLPSSKTGDTIGGDWQFGQNVFDPVASYSLGWWDGSAKSNFDGGTGAYQNCDGGTMYLDDDPSQLGGPGRQLECFSSS